MDNNNNYLDQLAIRLSNYHAVWEQCGKYWNDAIGPWSKMAKELKVNKMKFKLQRMFVAAKRTH